VLVLAIDTSSAAVTAAVASVGAGVELLASRVTIDARAHGELLAPSIEAGLREAGVGATELGAIVAGVGPGPFTGLRIGLVTAAVLADVLAIPAYGVCSLDAIGGAIPAGADAARVLVAGDARRREIYWAGYAGGVREQGPEVNKPADVAIDGFTAMAGAGARLYAAVLGLPIIDVDYPAPAALVAAAAERIRTGAATEPLTPLYLRRPDAVEPSLRKPVLS
jgi:tRNA threonylcarbamoyl adenosine modification protein YeaZ